MNFVAFVGFKPVLNHNGVLEVAGQAVYLLAHQNVELIVCNILHDFVEKFALLLPRSRLGYLKYLEYRQVFAAAIIFQQTHLCGQGIALKLLVTT